MPETAIRIFRRYLKIEPKHVEEYIKFLRRIGQLDEAALQLAQVVNDENFTSLEGFFFWICLVH